MIIEGKFMSFEVSNSFMRMDNMSKHTSSSLEQDVLRYALREVKIGTPDSLELAVNMLGRKNIFIPELNNLVQLFFETPTNKRNLQFATKFDKLQEDLISQLEIRLNLNN